MRRAPLPSLALLLSARSDSMLTLPEDVSHYLGHVLRLGVGEEVELFDGEGLRLTARITETSPALVVEVLHTETVKRDAHLPRLHLVSAIPKGDRWEWLVEKATELGVHTIYPLWTERSVVQIAPQKAAKKLQRWEQIAQGAARQSHRALFPSIAPQQKIARLLSELEPNDDPPSGRPHAHLIASLHHENVSLLSALEACHRHDAPCQDIYLWTGPEGGWTAEELERFERLPATSFVSLGPRVLRAETAAIAMLTGAQLLLGDLAASHESRDPSGDNA